MSESLMEYFNKRPRIGTLSTSDKAGRVNSACFGSPQMIDEKTVVMGIGQNRSLSNLNENPYACFLIIEPAESPSEWKGVRVYLKMTDCQTSGERLEGIKAQLAKVRGQKAADMVSAAVAFYIEEIRPLVDFGQGWEKSV